MLPVTGDTATSRALRGGRAAFGEGWFPVAWSVAPGRLELLGNHVDYNGGVVLAGAIDRSIRIAIGEGEPAGPIRGVAVDLDGGVFQARADAGPFEIDPTSGVGPEQYLHGVIGAMLFRKLEIRSALRLSIAGDVPIGFGMSSSAALCVGLVNALSLSRLSDRDIVLIAQDAEHRVGSPVGAMDQSASVAGGVILFDGAENTFERLEPALEGYVFAVAHSGVSHAIGSSSYPRRVEESSQALALIQDHGEPDLTALGALSPEQWRSLREAAIPGMNTTLVARVDHVVAEVDRVRHGVAAIRNGDWPTFGRLMTESGRSSAGLYEISHPLVEELVSELLGMPGVAGARMMGGGEGGPALALIESDAVENVGAALRDGYHARHNPGTASDGFQVCGFGPGATLIPAQTSGNQ